MKTGVVCFILLKEHNVYYTGVCTIRNLNDGSFLKTFSSDIIDVKRMICPFDIRFLFSTSEIFVYFFSE